MGLEVVRDEDDRRQFDATTVHGMKDDFVYRWARNDPVNLGLRESQGYRVVERTTERSSLSDRTRVKEGEQVDNTLKWGRDMVLMAIPRDLFDKRQRRENARMLDQTVGVTQRYHDACKRAAQADGGSRTSGLSYEEHHDNPRMTTVEDQELTNEELMRKMHLAPGMRQED